MLYGRNKKVYWTKRTGNGETGWNYTLNLDDGWRAKKNITAKKQLEMLEWGFIKKIKKYSSDLLHKENRTHNFAPELRETVYRKANIEIKI